MIEDSHRTWFDRAAAFDPAAADAAAPSDRPSALPRPTRAGEPLWAAVSGMLAGAAGGVVWLGIASRRDATLEPRALVVAALAGAALGGCFGRVTRRLIAPLPRILLGATFFGALGIVAYSFCLPRVAPGLAATLPAATTLLAAVAYGACAAAIPPLRVRWERGRRV